MALFGSKWCQFFKHLESASPSHRIVKVSTDWQSRLTWGAAIVRHSFRHRLLGPHYLMGLCRNLHLWRTKTPSDLNPVNRIGKGVKMCCHESLLWWPAGGRRARRRDPRWCWYVLSNVIRFYEKGLPSVSPKRYFQNLPFHSTSPPALWATLLVLFLDK